ncbi:MAG: protein kinase [Planctomycetales bacterium]|nr:protein kinase [Planctomycetales bacterium]
MHSDDSNQVSQSALLDAVAEEFLERLRAGGRPSLREYQRRYPHLADEIAALFPTLASLENYDHARHRRLPQIDFNQPENLGDYRILRELGRGGMGIVYEAEHVTLRRRVALKVLPNSGKQSEYAKRFLREARAAGQLHHTNIVPVFEIGDEEGVHFYAMQLIDGQNLDVVLDELRSLQDGVSPLQTALPSNLSASTQSLVSESGVSAEAITETPSDLNGNDSATSTTFRIDAVDLHNPKLSWSGAQLTSEYFRRVARGCLQVAEALAFAHAHGVLHRDIKPSNLLLDTDGVIWVSDFGLAKDDSENLTHSGDIVGTLRYMAPERFSMAADARSDIYSLGLTLYEMCTLKYAFDESDRARLIHQISHSEPVQPRRIQPTIPRDLETIILKATAHEPASRYQSANQLVDDLDRFLTDRPLLSNRASTIERSVRWLRRNPSYAMLLGCIGLIAMLIPLAALGYAIQADQHASELMAENSRVVAAQIAATEANLRSSRSLYESYVGHARASRWSRRVGQRYETLKQISNAVQLLGELQWSIDEVAKQRLRLRNIAIAAMPLVDVHELRSWPNNTNTPSAMNHSGKLIAWGDNKGRLLINDVETGKNVQTLLGLEEQVWSIWFDPSDRFIIARYNNQSPATPAKLLAWELASGKQVLNLDSDLRGCRLAFHPRQELVYICRLSGNLDTYSLTTGQRLNSIALGHEPDQLIVTPEGNFAFCMGNHIRIVNQEGLLVDEISVPLDIISTFAWTPSGGIYVSDHDGSLIHSPSFSSSFEKLGKHRNRISHLWLNQTGSVAFVSAWGGNRAAHQPGNTEAVLNFDEFDVHSLSTSSRRIGLSVPFRSHEVWEYSDGTPLTEITTMDEDIDYWSLVEHPKHSNIYALASEAGVEFWDLEHQQLLVRVGQRNSGLAFSPSGDLLYIASIGNQPTTTRTVSISTDSAMPKVELGEAQVMSHLPAKRPLNRTNHLSMDHSGKWLATLTVESALVYNLDDQQTIETGKHHNISRLEISPDARYLVTTTWHGQGVKLWDATTGKLLQDLMPKAKNGWTSFSPDGKWLAYSSLEADYIWDTATWTPKIIERGDYQGNDERVVFSPDSSLMLLFRTTFQPRLVSVATGQEIAVLESPKGFNGVPVFSRDGSKIILAGQSKINIWNLTKLRRELGDIGLDW